MRADEDEGAAQQSGFTQLVDEVAARRLTQLPGLPELLTAQPFTDQRIDGALTF